MAVLLKSGKALRADIIIPSTGFDLCVLGDMDIKVDGQSVDFSRTVGYRGLMFTGGPNLTWVFGYFQASWILTISIRGI